MLDVDTFDTVFGDGSLSSLYIEAEDSAGDIARVPLSIRVLHAQGDVKFKHILFKRMDWTG